MRIVESLSASMRDGVGLRGDLYQPDTDERRPVILIRTPYGKQGYREDSLVRKAVERGLAVFVQDVRGRYASGGEFDPYRQDGRDGYDTVEWLATQAWSNGRIGGSGLSYPGAAQWLLAVEAPPHLTCIFPAMCFFRAAVLLLQWRVGHVVDPVDCEQHRPRRSPPAQSPGAADRHGGARVVEA